ncbi:hypothetical protein EMPG_13139 [Blastomyces silverae]|uniref:Uncharacterized protein n=1 Tax=Blastomyces silverae TaxID=2060906 RepID=A0A0H1BJH1_9EURO|nr:hypothetical protein EMPG_13139 [Blastomyces silverae]
MVANMGHPNYIHPDRHVAKIATPTTYPQAMRPPAEKRSVSSDTTFDRLRILDDALYILKVRFGFIFLRLPLTIMSRSNKRYIEATATLQKWWIEL